MLLGDNEVTMKNGYLKDSKIFDCPSARPAKSEWGTDLQYAHDIDVDNPTDTHTDYFWRITNDNYGPFSLKTGPELGMAADNPLSTVWNNDDFIRRYHKIGYQVVFLDGSALRKKWQATITRPRQNVSKKITLTHNEGSISLPVKDWFECEIKLK